MVHMKKVIIIGPSGFGNTVLAKNSQKYYLFHMLNSIVSITKKIGNELIKTNLYKLYVAYLLKIRGFFMVISFLF